ncbi:uroporphyrinogen decarboxylase family protein [Streptomyces sp. L7]
MLRERQGDHVRRPRAPGPTSSTASPTSTAAFLKVQIEAGASAVQLFDSWAGALSPPTAALGPPRLREGPQGGRGLRRPRIHFGVGTGELLQLMGEAGADVVGVDYRVALDEAARRVGPGKALQGNLDPAVLFASTAAVEAKTREVLHDAKDLEGHIFNLGHGVMPSTDPDALTRLTEFVHAETAR